MRNRSHPYIRVFPIIRVHEVFVFWGTGGGEGVPTSTSMGLGAAGGGGGGGWGTLNPKHETLHPKAELLGGSGHLVSRDISTSIGF